MTTYNKNNAWCYQVIVKGIDVNYCLKEDDLY